MSEGMTRRMYRRVVTECEGCILTANTESRCRVRDLSLNGFRLQTDIALALGSMVMVRIWIPGETQPIDIDQAVVRWASHAEVGLQVVAISTGADFQLARYVERLLA